MCLLNITKVSDAGERCWGVVLVDGDGLPILRSEKGVRKAEVISVAKVLKFEGPDAPVIEEGKGEEGGRPCVADREDGSWLDRPVYPSPSDSFRLAAQRRGRGRVLEDGC